MGYAAILSLAVLSCVIIVFLKRSLPEYSVVFSVAVGCIISVGLVVAAYEIIGQVNEIFDKTGMNNEIYKTIIKTLGICYLTSFAADTCRDFGQTSIAGKVELSGKISVALLSLPLVREVLNTALELLK